MRLFRFRRVAADEACLGLFRCSGPASAEKSDWIFLYSALHARQLE